MFDSLKEIIKPSQLAEKIGGISDIEKKTTGKIAFILRPSDMGRIKEYLVKDGGINESEISLYLKSKKNEPAPFSDNETVKNLSENHTIKIFDSNRALFKLLKGTDFTRILIFYADKIDRPNLFFEIAAFKGKRAEVIGIDGNNDFYNLPKKFYRYKFLYTTLINIFFGSLLKGIKLILLLILALILSPFVTLFWGIMLILMTLISTGKKTA